MKHIMGPDSRSKLSNVKGNDIQPNAVDLRIEKIFKINEVEFFINEERKGHRGSKEIYPDDDGYWLLDKDVYEVVMSNSIIVGDNEAGWVVTRSTLNRNGVFLTSGLYDSGYDGCIAATMHVNISHMKIKRGTRIGQYLSFNAEALHSYNGDYGQAKEHDLKYV